MTKEEFRAFVRRTIDEIDFDDVRSTGFDAQADKIVDQWESDVTDAFGRGIRDGQESVS